MDSIYTRYGLMFYVKKKLIRKNSCENMCKAVVFLLKLFWDNSCGSLVPRQISRVQGNEKETKEQKKKQ
jgi:hypothetical protein